MWTRYLAEWVPVEPRPHRDVPRLGDPAHRRRLRAHLRVEERAEDRNLEI